jgi:PAS domain S-box-containing protein
MSMQAKPRPDTDLRDEMQFRQLVAAVTDYAIYMLDPRGFVVTWNPGAERIKGYTRDEIVGKHFSRFYTPEDRAAGVPDHALKTARENDRYESEAWRLRKDGTRFWAAVVIDAIRDENGELVGFAKITRDMTERRAMQEQLMQSQKMEVLGQLTGGIAHDFNNLLTVILGNLETISRHVSMQSERLQRAVEHATLGAQRAATLTQQLLAFARRQPLNPKPLDVNQLVGGMSELLARTLGETVNIDIRLAAGVWLVEADSHQLENALLNLAVNARDAMPQGGTLTVRTSNVSAGAPRDPGAPAGDLVLMSVTDTGVGMSEYVVAHAFEPFFTTKPVGQGTGLGLSQVLGFVAQSGGHIAIESAPNEGSTLRIYLPRLIADAQVGQAVPAAHQAEVGGDELILVVEDDVRVRAFSADCLRDLGYQVIEAADAPQALETLQAHPEIRLMFTDIGLPGLNGRDLVDAALKIRPQLKVLYTSGYAREVITGKGRLEHDVVLLTKPFTRPQLAARMREVLDRARN